MPIMLMNKTVTTDRLLCCRWPGRRCRGGPGQRSGLQQQQQLDFQHQEELQPGSTLQLSEPAPPAHRQRQKHGQLFPEGRGRADCGLGQRSLRTKKRICWRDSGSALTHSHLNSLINCSELFISYLPQLHSISLLHGQRETLNVIVGVYKDSCTSWQCCHSHFLYEGHCTFGLLCLRNKEHGYVEHVLVKGDGRKRWLEIIHVLFLCTIFPPKANVHSLPASNLWLGDHLKTALI